MTDSPAPGEPIRAGGVLPRRGAQRLSARARRQVLEEWTETAQPYPAGRCWHEEFARWAARDPDAVAVESLTTGERLSYGELDQRANRLAHYLRALGVGPEIWVGLALERSVGMVVGLLGILKAGGAYVPLDPSYPAGRLAWMVGETRPRVVVSEERLLGKFPELGGAAVVCLDREEEAIAAHPETAPESGVMAENAAYVIFTSGSTGRPKGVVVPHTGVLSLAEAQVPVFGVGPGDRLLLFAPLAFDTSVFELVMAQRGGATLCVLPQEELLPGPGLVRRLQEGHVTRLTLTPSALSALPVAELPEVAVVTVAGEACSAELVERWAPGRRFYNCYGPTEVTVWASVASCRPGEGRPPIGRAVGNKRLYVLDGSGEPVPVGVVGELWIGGVGVARGYLHRPDLTAERFLPDPFGGEPGARLYRTGDLVRWRPAGQLDFVGRSDDQVKVRGYRIEPGEIEAVLGEHPGVREAVVLARGEGEERRLVGYVVAAEASRDGGLLRRHLAGRLPEYMVPSAWVFLDELPRSANDKVDREALPDPDGARQATAEFVPPQGPVEEKVAAIWREVLRLDAVGSRDDFFEHGGHSLLAAQVLSRVNQSCGVELPLRVLFERPTVAGLAQAVFEAEVQRADAGLLAELLAQLERPEGTGQ